MRDLIGEALCKTGWRLGLYAAASIIPPVISPGCWPEVALGLLAAWILDNIVFIWNLQEVRRDAN